MSAPAPGRVLIIGAGPCGLAAGRELARLGHDDWTLFERSSVPGGHASSVVDSQGFTWDLGGHVVFSHFGEFDALVDDVMGDDVGEHERSSFVRFGDRWVPYPFQNNLRYLEPDVAYECLVGLIDAPGGSRDMDFASWMEATFGAGITRHFMRPYNEKVWTAPLDRMSSTWIAERVSVLDYRRALRNVVFGRDDVAWGPNNMFRFPKKGGTGEIYRRVAERLGERVVYERAVVRVDARRKLVFFQDGGSEGYDALVSTMPLDVLVDALVERPPEIRRSASQLEHSSVAVVGAGYEAPLADDRSWMYFPHEDAPFYRVTNFAKYASANVPNADVGRFCSYLTETAYSRYRARPPDAELRERVTAGLAAAGLVASDARLASTHVVDVEHAYPIPTLGRDAALHEIQPWLLARDIYSRGRFGSWRYEIGNMDHAVKMGTDVARYLVERRPEELWRIS